MRPRNAFRNSVFGASKLASAKTPLLKPYYRLHGPPVFFLLVFCFVLFTGIRCGVDIAQKPNKSGQILDQRWKIFFVICTKLIPRRKLFLYCKTFGVDGTSKKPKPYSPPFHVPHQTFLVLLLLLLILLLLPLPQHEKK